MPIFEYKCAKCGNVAEFLQSKARKAKIKCPQCGTEELEKLVSVFAPGVKQGDSKQCRTCNDRTCPHSQ
ncbi:MAG: zinc ribbon domain-containing protein [Planctomycetota bacterium]|nr:MAG: zinc ribbon domain-containing protein [Planctomycetota bacterium]